MQFVPVDVSAGGDVADHRVVLPAVPQPPDHLDRVGGLVEQVSPDDVAPTEQLCLVLGTADPHLPTRPAVRDEVKRGNGFGDVKRLGVGNGGDRNETDVMGQRRDPRCDQHGIGPTGKPAGFDLGTAAPLRGECVVEGHEVQQPAFGGDDEVGPVPAAGDGLGARRLPPCLGMPAVSVERDGQVQMPAHRSDFWNATG